MRSSVLRMAARIKGLEGSQDGKSAFAKGVSRNWRHTGSAYPFKNSFKNSSKSLAGGMASKRFAVVFTDDRMSAEMEKPNFAGNRTAPQNSNGVLSKARLCIANEPYFFGLDVINAADEIDDFSAGRVVVKRVDGEIPAKRVLLQRAKRTVAQNHAALIMDDFVGYGLAEG